MNASHGVDAVPPRADRPSLFVRDTSHTTVVRGSGIRFTDADGRVYIDASSGAISVISIGHGVDEVADAMAAQARRLAYVHTWHFRHEPCMMGWKQGSQPGHDSDHTYNSVWEIDWEGKARIVGNEHPTQKPVEIFARPMRKHTRPGAVCFEPFSGSGSQIIAAERESRRCRAMELEPRFVDVAVSRWESFTGKKADRGE